MDAVVSNPFTGLAETFSLTVPLTVPLIVSPGLAISTRA